MDERYTISKLRMAGLHLAIARGFLMLAANGPGALSLDAKFGRGRVLSAQ